MLRRFSVNYALFSMLLDGLFVYLSFKLAIYWRPILDDFSWAADMLAPPYIRPILYYLFPIVWVFILLLFSVYDGRKNLRVANELTSLILGSFMAGIALAGTLYLTYRGISRLLFILFCLIALFLLISWRMVARVLFILGNSTYVSNRRVLIAGAGPVGREMQEKIENNPFFGLTLAGFLDDDQKKRLLKRDILGTINAARQVVVDHKIDDVVIALPPRAHQKVNNLVADLHDLPVKVWVIPDYFHLALHKAVVDEFTDIPMLDLRAPALNEYQRMIKRAFDLLLASVSLPFALMVMGIIAVAIRIDSPGPIIFRQKRVGENGRIFEMLKFRTMVHNAEKLRHLVETNDENGQLIHKHPDDPRVTHVGHFLRRTSLDELPQLFNVLRGDMSIVGPRPELPYLVQMYKPWQHKRFAVPQGITGWWQVNGRSEKPMHLHTEDDIYYVQNYSIWLDIHILLKTIWVVMRRKGAY
jgi:exopolysaccharide biosynthesis polyprenyl glycosylphosphotransferase